MTKMLSHKTDLVLQLLGTKAILFEIKSVLERTIGMVSKSSSKQMIELGRFLPLDELAQKINMTAVVFSATNKTGGFRSAAAWSFHDIGKVVNASKEDGLGWPSMTYTLNQMQSMGGFVFELSTRELNEEKYDWSAMGLVTGLALASIATGSFFSDLCQWKKIIRLLNSSIYFTKFYQNQ